MMKWNINKEREIIGERGKGEEDLMYAQNTMYSELKNNDQIDHGLTNERRKVKGKGNEGAGREGIED